MTTPNGQPVNVAGEGSQVGVQALHAEIDTVIIPGDVQLTVGQNASPEAKYRVGVENLKSGNARAARQLIWDAMIMSSHVDSEHLLFQAVLALEAVVQTCQVAGGVFGFDAAHRWVDDCFADLPYAGAGAGDFGVSVGGWYSWMTASTVARCSAM